MPPRSSRFHRTSCLVALLWMLAAAGPPAMAGKVGFHVAFSGGHYGISYGFTHFRHRHHRHHRHHHRRGHHSGYRGRHHGVFLGYRSPVAYFRHPSYSGRTGGVETARLERPGTVAVFNGGDGWALMRENRMREAQKAFGGEAARRPGDGLAKAGFALASAAAGELKMAAWAMRRALLRDRNALDQVPVDDSLSRTALTLIDQFTLASAQGGEHARNAAFMRAALHYLLGESRSARAAMDIATANGERNPAAIVLRDLIEGLRTSG